MDSNFDLPPSSENVAEGHCRNAGGTGFSMFLQPGKGMNGNKLTMMASRLSL